MSVAILEVLHPDPALMRHTAFWQHFLLSRNIEKFVFCVSESVSVGIVVFVGVEWMSKKVNLAYGVRSASWVGYFRSNLALSRLNCSH